MVIVRLITFGSEAFPLCDPHVRRDSFTMPQTRRAAQQSRISGNGRAARGRRIIDQPLMEDTSSAEPEAEPEVARTLHINNTASIVGGTGVINSVRAIVPAMIQAIPPPIFYANGEVEVDDWLGRYESAGSYNNWSDDIRVRGLHVALQGTAANWWTVYSRKNAADTAKMT